MPVSAAVSKYNVPCFFNSAMARSAVRLPILSWRSQNPAQLVANFSVSGPPIVLWLEALGLRRAATARDHPKRPPLSEHDAEFQDLLLVRHFIFDFFHFVSFHDRSWDRLSQRTPTFTANKEVAGAVV